MSMTFIPSRPPHRRHRLVILGVILLGATTPLVRGENPVTAGCYVLEGFNFSGELSGTRSESLSRVDLMIPDQENRTGKLSSRQTSFAFGIAGVARQLDYASSAGNSRGKGSWWPFIVAGQLTLSELPLRIKAGGKITFTATLKGEGAWKLNDPEYQVKIDSFFSLNGELQLSDSIPLTAPEQGGEWTKPVLITTKGENGHQAMTLRITPCYTWYPADASPSAPEEKKLAALPEHPATLLAYLPPQEDPENATLKDKNSPAAKETGKKTGGQPAPVVPKKEAGKSPAPGTKKPPVPEKHLPPPPEPDESKVAKPPLEPEANPKQADDGE